MSRQEDACWRCGARWEDEDAPATTLRLIPGGADASSPATTAPAQDDRPAVAAAATPAPRS
jgi:hypothetical protein